VSLDLGVEVAELGVAVSMLGTLVLLGGRLQAVAHLVQELAAPGQDRGETQTRLSQPEGHRNPRANQAASSYS